MKGSDGLVSVIVPVYNRENHVANALKSILKQTYSNLEIIVINDGSTDGTLSVIEKFERNNHGVINIIDQNNSGQAVARNKGIKKARGRYVAFLDSDDTWHPEKLQMQIPLFRDNVGLVYSGINEVDSNGKIIRTVLPEVNMRGSIYYKLLVRNRMTGGSVVLLRSALEKVGLFDPNLKAAENWDLWIRIAREFAVDFVNLPLMNYLRHDGNMSANSMLMGRSTDELLKKHFPVKPETGDLLNAYNMAYANYYYSNGVKLFSNEDYLNARRLFIKSWKLVPNYRDTLQRLIRCFIGKRGNSFLSRFRTLLDSLIQRWS